MEEKVEKKEGLVEKVAKKVTKKKAAPKKEEDKAPKKESPKVSGSREIIKVMPAKNRAWIKEGDKESKVHRVVRRRTKEVFLAVPGGEKVKEEEWLSGAKGL